MTEDAVYVIRYEARLHKVGYSIQPEVRLCQLQTGEARRLELTRVWWRATGDAAAVESQAHAILAE